MSLIWCHVLIESDWNLNATATATAAADSTPVLIESDWNLNEYELSIIPMLLVVLIESDWNLNHTGSPAFYGTL